MFKHLLYSLRRHSTHPLALFRGCEYYSSGKSSRNTNGIRMGPTQTAEQPSSNAGNYVIPTAYLGLGAAVGGFAYYLHNNDVKRVIPKGKGQQLVAPHAGAAIGGPFTLVDTENKVFTNQDFGGKWVLLYFGYTSSPETGPTQVQKMAKTIQILESKHNIKVLPVFVTIDPKRDSTSHLKAYLREFCPRIVGLTGTNAAVKSMARQYRVYFKKVEEDGNDYLVETSHNLYLINPNMEIVRNFSLQSSEEERSEEILREINRSKPHITKYLWEVPGSGAARDSFYCYEEPGSMPHLSKLLPQSYSSASVSRIRATGGDRKDKSHSSTQTGCSD